MSRRALVSLALLPIAAGIAWSFYPIIRYYGAQLLRTQVSRRGSVVADTLAVQRVLPQGRAARREDAMLDKIADLVRRRDSTLKQIELWEATDPACREMMYDLRMHLEVL